MSLFGRLLDRAARQWDRARVPLPTVVTALLCFILVGLFLIGVADWFPDSVQPAQAGSKPNAGHRLSLLSSNRLAPALPTEELRFVAAPESNAFLARGRRYSVLVQAAEATLVGAAPAAAMLRLRFVGANPSAIAVHGAKPLPGLVHTIKGQDPAGWRSGLKSFAEVIAKGVYPGIDVLYKGRNGHLEYDFLLAPGADPTQMRLQFEGITDLSLTAQGDLQLQTPFGLLRQPQPMIYQMDRGRRVAVAGGYRLLADNRVGFEVRGYRTDRPLVIDPLLELATTLGGDAADSGQAVAIDPAGDLYIAGITRSPDFPTAAAIQPELKGGRDLFIAKLSADGSALVYVTYLGGKGVDGIVDGDSRLALAVDRFGQVVIAGATASKDFPLVDPLQPIHGGGKDGFIAKLSADGSRLLFSTLLGGRRNDAITAVAVDAEGTIHAAGHTRSNDFPTLDPLQPTIAGKQDAFVIKLSADGRRLLQSTYLGGSGKDRATAIAVDENGALYLTGLTRSKKDFPVVRARQADFGGGGVDAFIAKLAADGSQWDWVSYLGGAGHDAAYGLALDQADRLLVCGETGSRDFPTRNPIQSGLHGKRDGFIARFMADGTLEYGTWLGGSKKERFNAIAVDRRNRIHVTGHSRSHDFPLVDALQAQHGGKADIVIVQLSADGREIQFSSLLGGRKDDIGKALAVGPRGAVTLTGSTRSRLDFPEVSPLQPGFHGVQDAFIVRISPDNRPPRITSRPITTGRVGRLYRYRVGAADDDGDPLQFSLTEAPQAMQIDPASGRIDWTPGQAGSFRITINVSDGQGGEESQSFELQIEANRAPLIHSEPVAAGTAGQAYQYAVEASDPDGDPLHYDLTTAPVGMTIDGATGVIDWLPDLAGHYPVSVTVSDDLQGLTQQSFTLAIVRINQAPVLQPIEPQSSPLGITLTLQLSAEDGDNDPLTYSATPLPLPSGAALDAATGLFRFHPERAGSHELTFAVSDGYAADRQTVTITVTAPDANADTTFSGRVLDASDAAAGITTPIAGAIVSFLGTGRSAVTDAQGYFSLTQLPGGEQLLDIDPKAATAPNGEPYAGFRERYRLAEHADNEEARPFYLPRIAAASLTPVDPDQTTEVRNDALAITLSVPPHTAKNPNGSDFTGQLSVSPVPRDLAPAELPEFLDPGLLITIQPVGVTFATPLPITFPNSDNLPPGSEVDIWSLDPDAGRFTVVAAGRVSADGQTIETISGGIRAADWHTAMPPKTDAAAQSDAANCGCGHSTAIGSSVNTRSGWLSTDFTLPSIYSQGQAQSLRFVYRSDTAWPQPVIPFDLTIPVRAAVPPKISYHATLGGVEQAGESFVHTQGLSESQDETLRGAVRLDAADLATGVYPVTVRLTSHYQRSRIASLIEDKVTVVNAEESPFGAGWGIAGVSRLYLQADGGALISDGGGAVSRFTPMADSIVEFFTDDFEEGASASWSDRATSEAGAFTRFLGRFGNQTAALNLSDLPEHKAVLLHFDFYAIDSWDGNSQKYGPDWFRVGTGSQTANLFNETFTVFQSPQSYDVTQPDISGRNLGFASQWNDSIYRRLNNGWIIPHRADTLTINFSGSGLQGISDESWGIDNLRIELLSQTFGLSDATTSGDIKPVAPLPSVALGQYEHNHDIRVFNERHLFQIPADLTVDVSRPGLYADGKNLTPGTLPAGTLVNSYFVHVDPVGVSQQQQQGTVTFDREVIGIIGTAGTLNASNAAYGAPGITYPADSGAGLELGDSVTLSADRRSVTIDFTNSSDIDQLRILTRADGVGSINRFASAKGDFSSLTRDDDGGYIRTLVDGTQIHYNAAGLQSKTIDRNGNTTTYVYQDQRLTRIIDPVGRSTTLTYSGGRLESITDPAGRTTSFEYDQTTGDLTRITFPDGSSRTFGYNERHLMTSETDERGFATSREYDNTGRLLRTHRADGTTREAAALVTAGLAESGTADQPAAPARPGQAQSRFTDGAGHTRLMRTDRFGRLTEQTDANGLTTVIERNADGLPERLVRPDGSTIVRQFNQAGRMIRETEQFSDAITSYTYDDSYHLLTAITDPLGHTTTFRRDARGNVERIIDALGHSIDLTYTEAGLVHTITDANGLVTVYTYTPQGLVESVTETPPQGGGVAHQTHFTYDPAGQLQTITTADAITLELTYDLLGRLTRIEDPLGQRVDYQYDAAGNPIGSDISGSDGSLAATITQTFDALSRLTRLTQPHKQDLDSVTRIDYDRAGNPKALEDPNGNPTDFVYDPGDRIQETIDALNGHTRYRYDDQRNGDLEAVIAPNGAATEFDTDPLGRTIGETGPDRGAIDYTYDKNDNLTTRTDARGLTVAYDHDPLDRLTAIHYPDSSEDIQFGYDACLFGIGRLCRITDQSGVTDYQYDAYGNITRIEQTIRGIPYTQTYSYDAGHDLIATTLPSGRTVTYRYDSLKRLQAIDTTLNGQPRRIVDAITYQADGRITARLFGNGLVETRSYDLQGRLQLQSLDSQTAYDYDANGNLVQRTGRSYRYDPLDRLSGETDDSRRQDYGYDPNGNRETQQTEQSTVIYSYADNSNRLSTIGQNELIYDAAGRLTKDARGRSLTYNQAGRLTTISDNATELARYTYNANGQRVIKTTPGATVVYHYDQSGRLIGETKEDGTPIRDYLWHGLTPIAQIEIGETTETILYLHTDHLATPRLVTNATGHTVWRWNSDAFGAATADEDPDGNGIPTRINLRFAGQYFDSESGLFYNHHRYYSPEIGRYITSDPIGLGGGLNTYGYVGGNPVNYYDPLGLCSILATTGAPVIGATPCRFQGGGGIRGSGSGSGMLRLPPPVEVKLLPAPSSFKSCPVTKGTIPRNKSLSTIRQAGLDESFVRFESANVRFSKVTPQGGLKPGSFAAPTSELPVPLSQRATRFNLPDPQIPRTRQLNIRAPGDFVIGPRPVKGGTGNEVLFPFGTRPGTVR